MGTLNNLVGQESLRQKLGVLIEDTRRRGALLPHMLLCGPQGRGKATFAAAIANQLQRDIRSVDSRSIEKAGDLAALLTNLAELDILGIENIDAAPSLILEMLELSLWKPFSWI